MEIVFDFLANYYLYFLIIAGVLVLALIGFIVDMKKKGKAENNEVNVNSVPAANNNVDPVIPELPNDLVAGPGNNMPTPSNMEPNSFSDVQATNDNVVIPGPPVIEEVQSETITMPEATVQTSPVVEENLNVSESVIDMNPVENQVVTPTIGEPIVPNINEPQVQEEMQIEETPILDLSGVTENKNNSNQEIQ